MATSRRIEMKTRQLGNSDLMITPIGFGAWAIGGSGWEFGWGEQDDKQSVAASIMRWSSGSTGSTPRLFMGWAILRKSSPWHCGRGPALGHMFLRNAVCVG